MMEENDFYKDYLVKASWRAAPHGLEGVADLFTRQMMALGALHPKLREWFYINPAPEKYILDQDLDDVRPFVDLSHEELLRLIVDYSGLVHDEKEASEADFFICADNGLRCTREGAGLVMSGSRSSRPWECPYEMVFQTQRTIDPEQSLIAYPLMYGIVGSFIDLCRPDFVQARPQKLLQVLGPAPPFHPGWIVALPPKYAEQIVEPLTSYNERRADGYLIMSATKETFDADNPEHIARARDIGNAIAPLNEVVRRTM